MPTDTKSLQSRRHQLSSSFEQLTVLNTSDTHSTQILPFSQRLASIENGNLYPLRPAELTILQVNIGKMCNQTCAHCHVDAAPDRREIMTRQTMQQCLDVLAKTNINTIDITGGAPEMNPHFRWFVEQITALGRHVINRCNLTIIVANPKYRDLPQFFAQHKVEVVSSLPHFSASRTDRQRGQGVFESSIEALQLLNKVGYGQPNGLPLHLVYNPSGAFLPANQAGLEAEFKRQLKRKYGIIFHRLYAITNMPISRFLEYLLQSGNYEIYMQKLFESFNPATVTGLMCRNTLSVSWDGYLYDCDFNQMLDLHLTPNAPQHITEFDARLLAQRHIVVNQHCYGCTAGAGSSCGGETV